MNATRPPGTQAAGLPAAVGPAHRHDAGIVFLDRLPLASGMHELVYTSAAKTLLDPLQLGAILASARRNNPALGVSGILLYHQGSFMQLLEGELEPLRALYVRISQDPRHHRLATLRERLIEQRSFASWSMGFVALDPRLLGALPGRHALSSNGTLQNDADTVLPLLDQFRDGRHHRYIMT